MHASDLNAGPNLGRFMPIEMSCPFCQKTYKLKDELAGKKVTCANVTCRRAFQVPGTAQHTALGQNPKPNPPAKPATPAKPAKASNPDADAEALAALNDDPSAAPQDIEMLCVSCDHKWNVGLDMQGKNVLCPECRHRQKVPVMKDNRRDWRVKEGAPSLAKQEKLEGVQATTDVTFVSGEALRKTGVIQDNYEARPLRFWFLVIGVPIVTIGILVAGLLSWRTSSKEMKLERFVNEAIKEIDEAKDLPTAEAPLFRAALRISAGEFAIHRNDPEGLKDALNYFAKARQELDSASPSLPRDLLLAELAVANLELGGTDDEVIRQVRIRWTPAPAGTSRAKLNEKTHDVQAELLSILKVLRREDRPAAPEARQLAIRRLAKELSTRGKPEMLDTLITGTTFFDTELNEAHCLAAAEVYRISGKPDKALELATNLKPQIQGLGPAAFQAICLSVEPPITGVALHKLSAGGDLQDGPRLTHTLANILQKKPDDAFNVAKRGGPAESRARALAFVAETSTEPAQALEAAREAVNPSGKGPAISDFILARLAIQAGRIGNQELFDHFTKAMKDERSRSWAKGESVRQKLQSGEAKTVEESLLELPQDPKDYRVGMAWGRLAMARNNAKVLGQSGKDAAASFDRWGAGSFKPFGLTGLALGLQDRDRSGAKP